MKRLFSTSLLLFLLCACSPEPITMTTAQGTFILIRPEGPIVNGVRDIELWQKEGVSTNQYVYMRSVFADGSSHFTRLLP